MPEKVITISLIVEGGPSRGGLDQEWSRSLVLARGLRVEREVCGGKVKEIVYGKQAPPPLDPKPDEV